MRTLTAQCNLVVIGALCVAACGIESSDDVILAEGDQAERIVNQVDRIAPDIAHASRIGVYSGADSFQAHSEHIAITIPLKNSDRIKLVRPGQESRYQISLGLPFADAEKQGVIAQDGTITYQEGLRATDVAVQAFDHGVRIQTILNNETAPSEFVYTIDIPADASLVMSDNGGVLVVDNQGALRGGVAAPWAFDDKRRSVPTHYEVRGNTIVQIVEHADASFEYPIVADPWLGFDLIASASWGWRGSGWTLFVSPTGWARANGGGYAVGVAGWDELYSKYKNRGLNTNLGGMRDQFICHQQFAFLKSTWNLDEWRPDVSYAATVAAACNPGGGVD